MWYKSVVDQSLSFYSMHSVGEESGFTWRGCPLCHQQLGGDRLELLYVDGGITYKEHICIDCALYVANGDVPEEAQ